MKLHKYSPVNDTILQDNTIVFLIAKAFVPSGNDPGNILLEAIHLTPFPGNPKNPNYVNSVPDFSSPAVFAHGTVSDEQSRESTGTVTFLTTVSNYVRGSNKQTTIQCAICLLCFTVWHAEIFLSISWWMDKKPPRWSNIPMPNWGAQLTLSRCWGRVWRCSPMATCVERSTVWFSCPSPHLLQVQTLQLRRQRCQTTASFQHAHRQ